MEVIAGSRCLIILEGLDEMAADHRKSDLFFTRLIKHCTVLEKATVMITSRPHACAKLVGRQVEVIGFGAEQIEEFIKRSFPNDKHSVSELLQQLNDYPHLKSLCYVPLNLVMVTDIFKCREKKLPLALTELYKLFLVMTLRRHITKKEDESCMYSGVSLTAASLTAASLTAASIESFKKSLPGIPINAIGTVFLLCKLSFHGFFDWHTDTKEGWYGHEKKWKNSKIIFTMEDLIQCGIEVTDQFDGLGLLKATHIHDVPMDTSIYNFSHLTIQDFLTSLYISLLPQGEQVHLIYNHFHDFSNVFVFLCGLTRLKCNEMYQIIFSKLMSYDDVVLAVRCLYESKCTVKSTVPFTLNMSETDVLPYDCYCVSYMISHYPVLKLKMSGCYVGDTGAEMLAKHYFNENVANQLLELLDLSSNILTFVGMEHVMKIVKRE